MFEYYNLFCNATMRLYRQVVGGSLPTPVLGHLVHDRRVQFDTGSSVGDKDDTLLQSDTAGRLDVGSEFSRKCDVSTPTDGVAVEDDELLVRVGFHSGVPQSTSLLESVEVASVAVIVGSNKHDGVKVRRSTGLERELGIEADGAG